MKGKNRAMFEKTRSFFRGCKVFRKLSKCEKEDLITFLTTAAKWRDKLGIK